MANSANFEASLRIKAGVEGTDNINKLAESISEAGLDVTHLTDESAKLAKQFGEIEQKQALITQFRELKAATTEANTAWQQAQAATADYAKQMDDARERADALKTSLKNSSEMSQEEAKATRDEYKATLQELKNLDTAHQNSITRSSQLKTQYEGLNSSLVRTRSAMHDVGLATTNLNAQQKALEEESQAAKQSLAELTSEAERLNEIAKAKIALGIDTDDKARQQLEEINQAYETLRASGTLTEEELARATQAHTAKVAELEEALGETKPSLEDLAGEFGKVVSAAGGLTYVTKQAIDFETAMSGVKKMVDGTPEQIEKLSHQIQQMSIDMGMTTDSIAEISAMGGGLGVPIEKLGQFTEMAGKMSVAFDMSAESAGDAAAKLSTVFDIPIEQVGGLADSINVLGNTTAAKESEIVDAMLRIGGNAKQFGLAGEQAAALAAAMISLGKPPEVAATAINALLTKLQTANVQSDDFKNTLSKIGINANQMADDIQKNPQQALSNFLQTLKSMDSQQRSITTFKLFGQDYVDDVNALVGSLDSYNKALDSVKDKSSTAGAMQKEFDAKTSTSAQSIERAKQAITVLAQTVGKDLLPVVGLAAKAVGGLAQGIGEFAQAHPVLMQIGVLLAGAQVEMVAFQSAMNLAGAVGLRAFGEVSAGAGTAATSVNLATAAAGRFNVAMSAMGNAAQSVLIRLQAFRAAGISGSLSALAGQMMSLNGLFAAAAGWSIGTALGESLYKNSELARSLGDHLAMIPAAINSIVTTGGLDKFNQNFETSAESAKRLAEAEKAHAKTIEGKAEAYLKADQAAKQSQQTNEQLAESIKQTDSQAKSLTVQMTVLKDSGQENSAEYKNLENQLNSTKDKLTTLTDAHDKATGATKNNSKSNLQLVNDVKLTEAILEGLKNKLADMEASGQKNTEGYKNLSKEVDNTKDKLAALKAEAEKQNLGDALKTDLDKASESFKALGLDAEEFATGIDSKTNQALTAFVDIAHLADGDTRKLALAYNAAKDAAGDNQIAQAALNGKLNQVTEGNKQLADAVKKAAKEQKEAKSAAEEQAAALDKLGISMEDANQGMSKGGQEMVQTLKAGITAIKEQATSADSLKTSLQQAFEQSIGAAKTKADFEALKKTIAETGTKSQLTAEQTKILKAGIAGGADAAKAAKDEIEKSTKALTDNAQASDKSAESNQKVARSYKDVGDAAKEAADKAKQAAEEQAQAEKASLDGIARYVDNFTASISKGLQNVGITGEQSIKIMNKALAEQAYIMSGSWDGFFTGFARAQENVKASIDGFNRMRDSAINMTQALGGANVGVNELADAEQALYHAQQANVDGMVRMDSQTLDNLKRQIDSTRQKLDDMAKSARDTADNLEADLARIKGNDEVAQKLEQTRKLTELQEKLNDAQKRGNSEEIAQLTRAIELQKQINAEQTKQAEAKKQQEQQAQKQQEQKTAQAKPAPTPIPDPTPTATPTPTSSAAGNNPNIAYYAKLTADEIAKVEDRAIEKFMKMLQDELKRQAR